MKTKTLVRKRSERGFSLLMIGACAIVMVGMLGLTTDLGRVYIAKNELQAFADAASVAAALKLDGTAAGLTAADGAGASGPVGPSGTVNQWSFATHTVPSPTITYAATLNGDYSPSGSAPANSRFAKVLASAPVDMYFIPIVPGASTSINVSAVATAGQSVRNTIGAGGSNGAAPFSPDAHNASDPNFGFTPGQLYTMKWPPNAGKGTCGGDVGFTSPNASPDRGYIDVGQGNSNSGLADVLVGNITYPGTIQVATVVPWVTGNKNLSKGLDPRFDQDTDTVIEDYATYKSKGTGNGRRLMVLPVNDPAQSDKSKAYILGFALFFMQSKTAGNSDPYCAEYVGTATLDSTVPGTTHSSPDQYYSVQLMR